MRSLAAHAFSPALVAALLAVSCSSGSGAPAAASPEATFESRCGSERAPSTPPPRDTTASPQGSTRWYLIERIGLGSVDLRQRVPRHDAWKCYGFELAANGATPATAREGLCRPRPGASSRAYAKGADGIDNSFGANVLPVLSAFDRCLDDVAVGAGGYALYLRLDGVGAGDTSAAPGALYAAKSTSDTSVPAPEARIDVPIARFPDGYVSGGLWVSGASGAATFDVPVRVGFGFELDDRDPPTCPEPLELRIPLASPVLSVRVADGRGGVLAGVASVDDFDARLHDWLAASNVCGNAADAIAKALIAESADLVRGAPGFEDRAATCDAISFGASFTAKATDDPRAYGAFPRTTNACAR